MEAVKTSGSVTLFTVDEVSIDRKVAIEVTKQFCFALEYAFDKIKKGREFDMIAKNQKGSSLKIASESFRDKKENVFEAVKQYRQRSSESLPSNKELEKIVLQMKRTNLYVKLLNISLTKAISKFL